VATSLEEILSVVSNDTSLIGLSNIGEDDVDHADEHAVLEGITGIINDRDDVSTALSHVDKITTRTERELNGVDHTLGTDKIRDVGDGSTGSTTEVKNLRTRANIDVLDTTDDGGSKLRTERVPNAIFNLAILFSLDSNTLLTIDRNSRVHVTGDKGIILTLGNENTFKTMTLDDNLGTTTSTTASTAATAAGTTTGTTATTATTTGSTTTTATTATEATTTTTTTTATRSYKVENKIEDKKYDSGCIFTN
jgi:hypothetical protein